MQINQSVHPQTEERYKYKMVKILPKKTGKMDFSFDSSERDD